MFLAVAVWALIGCTGFVLAVAYGWLGPDAARGIEFCEQALDAFFRQPANTLSNLGFVFAGLAVAGDARRRRARSSRSGLGVGLATVYALIVVTLGPGSAAMHATQSELGGILDLSSMFLLSSFALAYAVARLTPRAAAYAVPAVFVLAVLAQEVAFLHGGRLPWVEHSGNAAFAATLLSALAIEARLARRASRTGEAGLDRRWLLAALGAMVLALGIWSLSKTGGPWCDPHSVVQGHAAWHLLCAAAAYGLYRVYAGRPQI